MYVVQTLTEVDGWINCWGVTGDDNVRRPDMYETEAEANDEMAEALRDDPSLELRVVKCKRFEVHASIEDNHHKEFWAADEREAQLLAEQELGTIDPRKDGVWRWTNGEFRVDWITCVDNEESDTSCEEPEVPYTATV